MPEREIEQMLIQLAVPGQFPHLRTLASAFITSGLI